MKIFKTRINVDHMTCDSSTQTNRFSFQRFETCRLVCICIWKMFFSSWLIFCVCFFYRRGKVDGIAIKQPILVLKTLVSNYWFPRFDCNITNISPNAIKVRYCLFLYSMHVSTLELKKNIFSILPEEILMMYEIDRLSELDWFRVIKKAFSYSANVIAYFPMIWFEYVQ